MVSDEEKQTFVSLNGWTTGGKYWKHPDIKTTDGNDVLCTLLEAYGIQSASTRTEQEEALSGPTATALKRLVVEAVRLATTKATSRR